jgi:hypothetical protein
MGKDLSSHCALLLGLDDDWKVDQVALEMENRKVRSRVRFFGRSLVGPSCGRSASRADLAPKRSWRHLDPMRFETELRARVPRADRVEFSVKTCDVPWAGKQSPFNRRFETFAVHVLESTATVKAAATLAL